MKRLLVLLAVPLGAACASQATVAPGHAALRFDPETGLAHDVLEPGTYPLSGGQKLEDFDVRIEKREETLRANAADGRPLEVKLVVLYRPIVAELYDLEAEIGHDYYDAVVRPEVRSVTRDVLGHAVADDAILRPADEGPKVLAGVRARMRGKHVEIASLLVEDVREAKIVY